jgi:hypothetical protein
MKRTRLNVFLLIGMIGVFTAGSNFAVQLYRAFGANEDIWWTARTTPLKIEETRNSFELLIDNKSIRDHLSKGSLILNYNSKGRSAITSGDITVRINNWYKVKSSILTHALLPCSIFSASLTLLIIGIIQVFIRKNKYRRAGTSIDKAISLL